MANTPNLSLPYLDAAQAQKHVTHNAALTALDVLVQTRVGSTTLVAPPSSPADCQSWIVAAGAGGAWAGKDNQIAAWQDGAWVFHAPQPGFTAYVDALGASLQWNGSAWTSVLGATSEIGPLAALGIGTAPDSGNPLSVTADNALFNALPTGSGGTGDMRVKLNKAGAGNTASFLFQDGFSGRAEFGLTGDDDFRVKTSPDGSVFHVAMRARASDGRVSLPQGQIHEPTGASMAGFMFTPGGDGQISIYRNDASRAQNPRTSTIASIASNVVTLSGSSDANLFYHAFMAGVSYARIWNTTKSPNQAAWVKAIPAANQLQVTSASDIAGWSTGDTVQIGDPASMHGGLNAIALDISPMLAAVLGAVFPQAGILAKGIITGVDAALGLTGPAIGGSVVQICCVNDGAQINSMALIPCTIASPISNSNLVFVRETVASPNLLGTALWSSIAVFG